MTVISAGLAPRQKIDDDSVMAFAMHFYILPNAVMMETIAVLKKSSWVGAASFARLLTLTSIWAITGVTISWTQLLVALMVATVFKTHQQNAKVVIKAP